MWSRNPDLLPLVMQVKDAKLTWRQESVLATRGMAWPCLHELSSCRSSWKCSLDVHQKANLLSFPFQMYFTQSSHT